MEQQNIHLKTIHQIMKADNKMVVIITLFTICFFVFIFQLYNKHFNYKELKLISDDTENNYIEQTIPDSLINNVKTTLSYYDIEFKESKGKLLILKKVIDDKELIKNISTKSKDIYWLERIKK